MVYNLIMPILINGTGPLTGVTSINTSVSDTELGYLDGVTSAIQTQINTAGGLVKITDNTFSAASAVNVNNCFSSTYTNYMILIDLTTSASAGTISLRLRASGTDAATNYNYFGPYGGSSSGNINNSAQTEWFVAGSYNSATVCAICDVFQPNVAAQTRAGISMFDSRNIVGLYGGIHTTSSAYDGFSLIIGSGTITGTLRVYGYRN